LIDARRFKTDTHAAAVLGKPSFRKIEWLERDVAVVEWRTIDAAEVA
jgi:hypothetical protein